jgi:ketosteroid isomerase-like protein
MTKYQRCSHQCCSQATDAIFVLVTHRAARIRHSLPAPCSLPSTAAIAIVLRAKYDCAMLKNISILLALTTAAFARDSANDAAQVWNLEKAYWEYVKANDLEKYRPLWHEDFLGWPYVSSAPTGKDHITDWITANTSKGMKLQSYSIEPLAIQVTGDIAINHYRIKATWATNDKAKVRTDALRITHTWIRTHDAWQILGGMSAPVNEKGQ